MLRMILALVFSLAVSLAIAPGLIAWLRKLKFGQTIYELGPAHQQKQGTPIMGGFIFMIAATVCALAFHPAEWLGVWDFPLALVVFGWVTMLTGFLDDFTKVTKKRNLGLTPMQKIAIQVVSAAAFSVYCYVNPYVGSAIAIPFTQITWDLGIFYIPLMTLLIIFMVNSANLQDGADGLLGSVSCVGSAGWAMMAVLMAIAAGSGAQTDASQPQYLGIAVFSMAMMGGTLGYLRHNYYPAKVFMGDTGSMFIGGITVGTAMLLRQPFMLILIGFTMIMSSLSVMLQVGYFKYTKKKYGEGRRIFKMSPIHHHFEKCGMTEPQIVAMYTAVTAVLSLIAVLSMVGAML